MSDILLRDDKSGIATLTLNAPERLNALSDAMLAALQGQIDALSGDQETRVVILKGNGKVFCAGHDLKEMQAGRQTEDGGQAYFADLFMRCARVMTGLMRLPQPVIAAPHGIATAAGCQMVAACDLAVAAEGTRFGVNGVNIGLFCSTPMVALSRNIPRKHAFEMLTTGEFIETGRAEALGLINHAVPHENLDEEVLKLAEKIAAKLNPAVRIGKRTFYDQIEMGIDAAYAHAGAAMVENMMWRDTNEGISAFLEKRAPDWRR
ncbi:enoyl-CoA hydratase/carnithine racemase [Rhodovulum bhavnagarense]|uniref:Enoyl-CoA hydratase domain-containing protein 3, mitochondrial n=1 Tax=Rhodovulum bhavnagarense TaxID=992286 RepID=A0A4R2RES2_9RHOB|nr:enoyl-CoA hydratase [Rhodovulum bhavnagarense]TCP60537.1 enoyl-CoA hydratase/carnithine racemase [Rhodovulum bhavnagarense]